MADVAAVVVTYNALPWLERCLTSLEGLACAREVADKLDAELVAVLLCAEPDDSAHELAAHGAGRVLVVRDPSLAQYATSH